ncbi:MAG: hypothetical protein HYW96_01260 [Candidatus Wildermuthbacteria bacterium]|nr:hypothetical protein [Candidatus Wildermuthbacteria bacterium]
MSKTIDRVIADIRILPTINQLAQRIDTTEAYARANQLLAQAHYDEAHAIIDGARALLVALLSKPGDASMTRDHLLVVAKNAKEVGELGLALEIVMKHAAAR